MNPASTATNHPAPSASTTATSAEEPFRRYFQATLTHCLRRGFALEECFGLVWEETCDRYTLSESQQRELFGKLISWARELPGSKFSTGCSQEVIHRK